MLAILAAAAGAVLGLTAYRATEAAMAAWFVGFVHGSNTFVSTSNAAFFLDVGTPEVFGLRVTNECTSAIVVLPIVALTGVLVASSRLASRRLVRAASAASGVFIVVNLIRLVLIADVSRRWGIEIGYRWSHVWVGSMITVAGAAVACATYLRALGIGRVRLQ